MPDTTPTWTSKDAATLKALLDRYIDARTEGLNLEERGPELARADLKGKREVSTQVSWSLELYRALDQSIDASLESFGWKLSDKLDTIRTDMKGDVNQLRREVLALIREVRGRFDAIQRDLDAIRKTLSALEREE